ncbi:hypothetical protein CPLU01_01340 [Colletotrichum plurivorum]|uniref:Uncharacterized protein n=1 Tax=Colletotrichum plurivorum TaxID=2175906 RepID=A0A8H6NPT2_9PEZI|nr:hypothetical protein CPLU01_01340 [Colletotrichum plurivorum]
MQGNTVGRALDWTPLTKKDAFLTLRPFHFGLDAGPVQARRSGAPIRVAFADILEQLRRAVHAAVSPDQRAAMIAALPKLKGGDKPRKRKKQRTRKSKRNQSAENHQQKTDSRRDSQSAGSSKAESSSKTKPDSKLVKA